MKTQIDRKKLKEFIFDNILPSTRGATSVLMALIGKRLGLFTAMYELGHVTAKTLAEATNTHERYVQEWLSALIAADWLSYQSETKEFLMTPEQAMVFVNEESLMYFQGVFGIVGSCYHDIDRVVSVFKTGEGIAWGERETCLFCSLNASSGPKYRNQLVSDWLPKFPRLIEKLEKGASIADVGCGSGLTTSLMAKAFPNSMFYGFDLHEKSIEEAVNLATKGQLSNLHFKVSSAKAYQAKDGYDLICFFDCLHDMGDPVGVLEYAYKALKPGGQIMLVEPAANDKLEDNLTDTNAIAYAMSTCICTPTSLSQEVGLGLGAQAGPERLAKVSSEAGFTQFDVVYKTMSHMVIKIEK